MRLAVCGHTNLDILLQVQEIPRVGQSVPVLDRRTTWGGTGANLVRHAASLGVETRLWGRVGDDFPAAWSDAMKAAGVDLSHLETVKGARTPTCFVMTDLLDRQSYCIDQGAMAGMQEHPPTARLLEGMGRGDWLHVGTGHPLAYGQVVDAAKKAGISIAFDPSQELRFMYDTATFEALLDEADLFFCNEEELVKACDYLGYGGAEQLLDHVDTVAVTRGAKGASLYRSKKKVLHSNAFPVRAVDPTGAGEAFRAGFYAAMHRGLDMEKALRWGQAAAAVKVQHVGPQEHVITVAEVEAILAK
jgi:sugar/nucleoside kinase (ribokinase family)